MKRKPKRRLSITDSHASSSTSTCTRPIASNISSSSRPLHKRFRGHATRGTPVHASFVSDPVCTDHSETFDDNNDDSEVYRKYRNSMNDTVSGSCGNEKENKENEERVENKECGENEKDGENTKDLDKELYKENGVGKEREKVKENENENDKKEKGKGKEKGKDKDRDKERVKEKGKDAKIRGRDREREATQDRSEKIELRAALEEILELKNEIKRLQAEVSFKDQVIESLHAQSKKSKPGLTCVICVEYMSNPCTISCGHTFCYDCLHDWLKIRRECPTCRKKISQRPTLSFVVKEQVETYVEQLAPDERESAKARLRDKEASLKEQSDPWREVFGTHSTAIIVDDADGRPYRLDESDHDLGLDSDEFDDDDDDSDGHLLYFYERNSFSGGRDIDSYSENDSIPGVSSSRESDPYDTDSTDRSSGPHSFIQQQFRTMWNQETQIEPIYTSPQSSNRHRRLPLATSRNSSRRQDNENTPRGSESSDGYHPSSLTVSDEDEEEETEEHGRKSARYPLRSRNYSIISDDTSDAPCTHLPLSQGTQYRLRSPILAATTRGSLGSSHDDIHSDDLESDDADDDTSSNSSDDDISYESEQRSLSTPVSDDAEDFGVHNNRQVRSIVARQFRPYLSGERYASDTRSNRWMTRG
ncbi:10849_t:CDS:2 [Paraglomus occultum]|uniref:10849_t:CDS:1 n=1 Tax=Paraglomus occultum TaxID=144539 RepID=A0A9N8YTT0_9GLOM|nr:10849_t:CDS:2 [Paraglomus occultum]